MGLGKEVSLHSCMLASVFLVFAWQTNLDCIETRRKGLFSHSVKVRGSTVGKALQPNDQPQAGGEGAEPQQKKEAGNQGGHGPPRWARYPLSCASQSRRCLHGMCAFSFTSSLEIMHPMCWQRPPPNGARCPDGIWQHDFGAWYRGGGCPFLCFFLPSPHSSLSYFEFISPLCLSVILFS